MRAVLIALVLSVSIIQVYGDGTHGPGSTPHSHGLKGKSDMGSQQSEAEKAAAAETATMVEQTKAQLQHVPTEDAAAAAEAAAETAVMVEQTKAQLQVINQVKNEVPMLIGASSEDGFNFNYYFLWHSDATILNYLARNRGNGGQDVPVEDIIRAGERDKPAQVVPELDNTSPTKTVSSNVGGFNSNHNFLWHSDATILNYLAQNRGNEGQAAAATNAPAGGQNGGGHHAHGGGHFDKHESLFKVLAGL